MEHTIACEAARRAHRQPGDETPDWPPMRHLPAEARDAVLTCPHWAHDTARFIVGKG